jgi:hypothetical protein
MSATVGTYCSPVFGSFPVQLVGVGLVMKAIEPIWVTKPETATRVRGRIERILDWAKVASGMAKTLRGGVVTWTTYFSLGVRFDGSSTIRRYPTLSFQHSWLL